MTKFSGFECDEKKGSRERPCEKVMKPEDTITERLTYSGLIVGSKVRHLCRACAPDPSTLTPPKTKATTTSSDVGVREVPAQQGV